MSQKTARVVSLQTAICMLWVIRDDFDLARRWPLLHQQRQK